MPTCTLPTYPVKRLVDCRTKRVTTRTTEFEIKLEPPFSKSRRLESSLEIQNPTYSQRKQTKRLQRELFACRHATIGVQEERDTIYDALEICGV
jgi:hypothetical protein